MIRSHTSNRSLQAMGDQDHADAAGADPADQVQHRLHLGHGEGGGRFVHDQQPWARTRAARPDRESYWAPGPGRTAALTFQSRVSAMVMPEAVPGGAPPSRVACAGGPDHRHAEDAGAPAPAPGNRLPATSTVSQSGPGPGRNHLPTCRGHARRPVEAKRTSSPSIRNLSPPRRALRRRPAFFVLGQGRLLPGAVCPADQSPSTLAGCQGQVDPAQRTDGAVALDDAPHRDARRRVGGTAGRTGRGWGGLGCHAKDPVLQVVTARLRVGRGLGGGVSTSRTAPGGRAGRQKRRAARSVPPRSGPPTGRGRWVVRQGGAGDATADRPYGPRQVRVRPAPNITYVSGRTAGVRHRSDRQAGARFGGVRSAPPTARPSARAAAAAGGLAERLPRRTLPILT